MSHMRSIFLVAFLGSIISLRSAERETSLEQESVLKQIVTALVAEQLGVTLFIVRNFPSLMENLKEAEEAIKLCDEEDFCISKRSRGIPDPFDQCVSSSLPFKNPVAQVRAWVKLDIPFFSSRENRGRTMQRLLLLAASNKKIFGSLGLNFVPLELLHLQNCLMIMITLCDQTTNDAFARWRPRISEAFNGFRSHPFYTKFLQAQPFPLYEQLVTLYAEKRFSTDQVTRFHRIIEQREARLPAMREAFCLFVSKTQKAAEKQRSVKI